MSRTLRLRLGETVHEVSVRSESDAWMVTIDGTEHRVETIPGPVPPTHVAGAVVQELRFTIAGRARLAIVARTRERILVAVGGRTHSFDLPDEQESGAGAMAGTGRVSAPMPGKVIAVLVAPGDRVEIGQPVIVIEAMKMETTLVADVTGEVTAVHVTEGDTVDADGPLVDVTPAD